MEHLSLRTHTACSAKHAYSYASSTPWGLELELLLSALVAESLSSVLFTCSSCQGMSSSWQCLGALLHQCGAWPSCLGRGLIRSVVWQLKVRRENSKAPAETCSGPPCLSWPQKHQRQLHRTLIEAWVIKTRAANRVALSRLQYMGQ
eukprot:6368401-Amphidinium_carterae.1